MKTEFKEIAECDSLSVNPGGGKQLWLSNDEDDKDNSVCSKLKNILFWCCFPTMKKYKIENCWQRSAWLQTI